MKKCPYCGMQNEDENLFCTECGKPIPQGRVCPHCGASVNDDDAFCSNCGKKVDEQPASDTSKSLQKICPHCGAPINEGDVFCSECCKKINDVTAPSSPVHAQRLCPNCKNQLDEDDVFCPHCGIKPRVAEPCVESNKVEENVNNTKITTEPIKEIVTSDERPSSTVSSEQPTLSRTSNQEEAKSHEKETEHIEGISSWAKYRFHIIAAIILLLLLIVGGWYLMSNKPSKESTQTETVEVAHHNFNPNQTLYHHFTGTFTDSLGTYPIELDFKTSNGNADDVIYKNVTLGGKIRMTCTKFGEDEILFEGKDGNNLFTINIHPDETDRFVGVAKDGKKTLEVKMKAECSHSSKSDNSMIGENNQGGDVSDGGKQEDSYLDLWISVWGNIGESSGAVLQFEKGNGWYTMSQDAPEDSKRILTVKSYDKRTGHLVFNAYYKGDFIGVLDGKFISDRVDFDNGDYNIIQSYSGTFKSIKGVDIDFYFHGD